MLEFAVELRDAGIHVDWAALCAKQLDEQLVKTAIAMGMKMTPGIIAAALVRHADMAVIHAAIDALDDDAREGWMSKVVLSGHEKELLSRRADATSCESTYTLLNQLLHTLGGGGDGGDASCGRWLTVQRAISVFKMRPIEEANKFAAALLDDFVGPCTTEQAETLLNDATEYGSADGIRLALKVGASSTAPGKWAKHGCRLLMGKYIANIVENNNVGMLEEFRHLMPQHAWTQAVVAATAARDAIDALRYMVKSGASLNEAFFVFAATHRADRIIRFMLTEYPDMVPNGTSYLHEDGTVPPVTIKRLFRAEAVSAIAAIIRAKRWPTVVQDVSSLAVTVGDRPAVYELLVEHGYEMDPLAKHLYDTYQECIGREKWTPVHRSPDEWATVRALPFNRL